MGVFFRILIQIFAFHFLCSAFGTCFIISKSHQNHSKSSTYKHISPSSNTFVNLTHRNPNVCLNFRLKATQGSTVDPEPSGGHEKTRKSHRTIVNELHEGDGGDPFEKNLQYLKLNDYMGSSFLQYALSIILGRALPDSRDGLKVVHRRILWAMNMLRLVPNGQFRKCAKVVGDVLGNYHPHSDKSVYDALCRLCQDFVMRVALVDGHGNFGTNNDPPAAMRYTECRLTPYSKMFLLDDINLDTVDLIPNFDNTHVEPLVLPSRVPNLLINGSSGIAVGLATNIPPHNPHEIIEAAIHLAKNNGVLGNEDELLDFVKGPDFPSGGIVSTTPENLKRIYKTGKGSILLKSKFIFEERVKHTSKEIVNVYKSCNDIKFKIGSRISIIVTEIPYNIKITDIIMNINKSIRNNNLSGIHDIRDESDRSGTRLVIELKRQISSIIEIREILGKLNNLTDLSHHFKCNFIALDKNGTKPIRFNLYNALSIWLSFRIETLKRKYRYLLRESRYHLNITKGYIIALSNLNRIIERIKSFYYNPDRDGSEDHREEDLERELESVFGLNKTQIKHILKMTLRQLSRLNEERLRERAKKLESEIENYGNLLEDDPAIYKEIAEDLASIQREIKSKRFSEVQIQAEGTPEMPKADDTTPKVPEQSKADTALDNVLIYNNLGYMGKIKLDNRFYKSNKNKSIKTRLLFTSNTSTTSSTDSDESSAPLDSNNSPTGPILFCVSNNEDNLLVFTKSKVYTVPNNKLKLCKRGYNLFKFLHMKPSQQDLQFISNYSPPLKDITLLGYDDGIVSIFNNLKEKKNTLKLKLRNLDDLKIRFLLNFSSSDSNKDLFIGSKFGFCMKVNLGGIVENMLAENRTRKNVRAMRLNKDDSISAACLTRDTDHVLILTNLGKCKLISSTELKVQNLKGKGYNLLRQFGSGGSTKKRKAGEREEIVSCTNIERPEGNRVLLISKNGTLCKKRLSLNPVPKHHKTKRFWTNMPENDLLSYSKLL